MCANLETRDISRHPAGVAALYLEYAVFVRRTLRLHGLSGASVEDGLQDVFLVAVRKLDGFIPRASHKTWLYAISARVAKEHRRRTKRKGGLLELEQMELCSPGHDPYTALATARVLRAVEERLSLLDDNRRKVFVLAEIEGLTVPEIARTLHVKINTVYSRLRAARRQFGGGLTVTPARGVVHGESADL
ncbi:MAG TPA: RNA polymerase sigma factor [Polyangiaceae bacterium]|nr:RNA polymerase sigma factor [Polyangiaceae bacterium]